ncbi:MAG: MFS transporter [Cycloclasticus sp.]|nr:MFS transporter [Cycloclasticus sp. 44_32_T64]
MNTVNKTLWGGIWLSFITGIAAAITVTKASPALLDIQKELPLSVIQIGWIMSSAALATVFLGIFVGSLSRKHGPKMLLQLALGLIIITAGFSLFINSANELIMSRVIEGVAVILVSVAAPTLIAHLSKPSDMGLTMGVWALWMPVGSVLAFLLSPFILEQYGWRWLWASSAFIAFPLLLLSIKLHDPTRLVTATANEGLSRSVIYRAVIMGTIFTCFTACFFSMVTYLPTYLIDTYQLSSSRALLITTLLPAFIIPGNLLSGFLIHRGISCFRIMSYPAAVLAFIIAILLHAHYSVELGLLLLALVGFFLGMIPTAIFALSPRLADKPIDTGRIIGIVITGQGPGILLAPPLAGFLIGEQHQWQNLYPLYLLLTVGIIVLTQRLKALQANS